MKNEAVSYNYLEDFLIKIRSKGRYSFTYKEALNSFKISEQALDQNLYRLKSKNAIAAIRKGFFVIIPPEYSSRGMLPAYLFIDDLMHSLNKEYYIALLSAAALHGAAHQQPMEYFVVISTPAVHSIKNNKIVINFLVKKRWSANDVVKKNTDAGYINVSSPELTALDLLYYNAKIGINRAFTVLQELSEEMNSARLFKVVKQYPQTAAIQRLGYLLDRELNMEKLSVPLLKVLEGRKCYFIPLVAQGLKKGETDKKWKIIVNSRVEGDL
ncbi:MAG: type IV toxin-antitoxin system AbiEi family antitoxin [Bacteroidetes bacterium]|nr:type IV toxin-antitoxin system AbiEi family antitoxin [Bacteroidota bacterium]